MKPLRGAAALSAAALLAAAEGGSCQGGKQVAVSVARAGSHCAGGGGEPSVTVVASEEAWRTIFPAPLGGEATPSGVDFARDLVVVVAMGQRPTGGHAVELVDGKALVDGGVAAFRVAFRAPAPGMMVTQVVTSPCLAVRLSREGVREVKVATEDGKLVGAAPAR